MSTPIIQNPIPILKSELTWLQRHERLIIALSILGVFVFSYHLWINHSADVADGKAQAAQKIADNQAAKNDELKALVQQSLTQNQQLVASLTAQNTQLAAAIANRSQIVQVAQQSDKTLPLPDLADHWQKLLSLEPGEIRNTDNGLSVSAGAARTTVQQLEVIPQLQQDSQDQKTIITNKDTQIDSLTSVIGRQQPLIDGLNTKILEDKKACDLQVADVKAQALKSKSKWFFIGVGVGYIGRILTTK